ncbi:hypothetical protein KR038_009456, partial [Drosophila bunnanda]
MHFIGNRLLSDGELEELRVWLRKNKIDGKKLRREFSDVLPLAELLKRDHPRLIDLYNYPKKCSVQLKLVNWETFNYKVMSKFNLSLSKDLMERLANGSDGAAEVLLYEVIRLEKRQRLEEERNAVLRQERVWEENDEVKTVLVNKQIGDAIVQVPQKMILYSLYEKVSRDSKAKDEAIETFQQRLIHMENILKVKSERIDELLMQMGKVPQENTTKD